MKEKSKSDSCLGGLSVSIRHRGDCQAGAADGRSRRQATCLEALVPVDSFSSFSPFHLLDIRIWLQNGSNSTSDEIALYEAPSNRVADATWRHRTSETISLGSVLSLRA